MFLDNKKISDEMFGMTKTINNVSRTANLYGKLLAIKDMQIYLLKQEKMLEEALLHLDKLKKIKN